MAWNNFSEHLEFCCEIFLLDSLGSGKPRKVLEWGSKALDWMGKGLEGKEANRGTPKITQVKGKRWSWGRAMAVKEEVDLRWNSPDLGTMWKEHNMNTRWGTWNLGQVWCHSPKLESQKKELVRRRGENRCLLGDILTLRSSWICVGMFQVIYNI